MDAELQIVFDGASTISFLRKVTEGLPQAILDQLTAVSTVVAGVMREKASQGATGDLKRSIRPVIDPELNTAVIKPSAPYGDAVETGSKPHWAPIGPLIPWAEMHGINPYALRWSIAQKGTQPHPYIVPTYDQTAPQVPSMFAEGLKALFLEARL